MPGTTGFSEGAYSADSGPARSVLGMEFLDAETTFRDLGMQLLRLEKGA